MGDRATFPPTVGNPPIPGVTRPEEFGADIPKPTQTANRRPPKTWFLPGQPAGQSVPPKACRSGRKAAVTRPFRPCPNPIGAAQKGPREFPRPYKRKAVEPWLFKEGRRAAALSASPRTPRWGGGQVWSAVGWSPGGRSRSWPKPILTPTALLATLPRPTPRVVLLSPNGDAQDPVVSPLQRP